MNRPRRFRRNGPSSPQAQYYLRELAAGRILPETVERRIRELKEEADDLEYFQRSPERVEKLRALVAEFEEVLKTDLKAAVGRSVDEALAPKPAPAQAPARILPAASPTSTADVVIPNKTHDGFRLDEDDRTEIARLVRQLKAGRLTPFGVRDMIDGLRGQESRSKNNKDRVLEIQTKIMRLDEALWIHEHGTSASRNPRARARNPLELTFVVQPAKRRRRNSDEDLRSVERQALSGDERAHVAWLRALARQASERLRNREEIVRSMARTFFVLAWARHEEESGREGQLGGELMDLAPETPAGAYAHAEEFARSVEFENATALDEMFEKALEKPGFYSRPPVRDDFGHYLVMEGLGHGVSWADSHPEHGFEIPVANDYDYFPAACESCGDMEDLEPGQTCGECGATRDEDGSEPGR